MSAPTPDQNIVEPDDDGPAWRIITTDTTGLPTGVAPLCAQLAGSASLHYADDIGGGGVYDCCSHPHLECWSESAAQAVLALLNSQHVRICS